MKVILDSEGRSYPDVELNIVAKRAIDKQEDFHVCNMSAILAIRAELYKMPVEQRPSIEWIFYDRVVYFDNDMRSWDAWSDPRVNIDDINLEILLTKV